MRRLVRSGLYHAPFVVFHYPAPSANVQKNGVKCWFFCIPVPGGVLAASPLKWYFDGIEQDVITEIPSERRSQ